MKTQNQFKVGDIIGNTRVSGIVVLEVRENGYTLRGVANEIFTCNKKFAHGEWTVGAAAKRSSLSIMAVTK